MTAQRRSPYAYPDVSGNRSAWLTPSSEAERQGIVPIRDEAWSIVRTILVVGDYRRNGPGTNADRVTAIQGVFRSRDLRTGLEVPVSESWIRLRSAFFRRLALEARLPSALGRDDADWNALKAEWDAYANRSRSGPSTLKTVDGLLKKAVELAEAADPSSITDLRNCLRLTQRLGDALADLDG